MGEAKKRQRELELWRSSLTQDETVIERAAAATFDRFVRPGKAIGMCYRLAFFLAEYLAEKGVAVEPVVGFINDGTGDIMTSHAWVEHNGRRVDLSLAFTEYPEVQLPGEVLILDRVIKSGAHYSYHREQGAAGLRALNEIKENPQYAALAGRKDAEHAMMLEVGQSSESRRRYLDGAPDGLTFTRLAVIVDGLHAI